MAKSRNRKLADLIVTAGVDIAGNVTFDGGSTSADLTFADGDKANFGAASDLQIYHDGSGGHSRIDDTGTGGLVIRGSQVLLEKYGGGYMINAVADGASELYHSGSKKLYTNSAGVDIVGTLSLTGGITLADNQIAFFGSDLDGRIKFDGTDTLEITASNGAGDHIKLKSNNISLQQANGNNYLTSSAGSATTLYFANAAKIATTSTGVSVTGSVTSTTGFTTAANTRVQSSSGMLFITGAGAIPFEVGAGSEKMRLLSDGLAIGSQSAFTTGGIAKLTVAGILSFGASNSDMSYIRRQSTGNYAWQTYDNNNTGSIQLQPYGGNVGIGTTSPNTKLHINQTSSGNFTEALRIENSGGGANEGNYIQWEVANTSGYGPRIGGRREGLGGIGLHFYTGEINAVPTEAMRIDHDGNVEVRDGGMLRAYRAGNSAYAGLFMDSGEKLYIRNSWGNKDIVMLRTGEVGIGTDAPSKKLHVEDSSGYQLQLDGGNNFWNVGAGFSGYYDGSFLIANNTGDKFTIDSTGKVGIGTSSPDAKLSVTSTTINSEDILYLKSGADNVNDYLGIAWELGVGGNGPHSAIRSFAGPSGSDARLGFLTTSNGGTTLTEGLSIAHDGKVGIGTTTPAQPLQIYNGGGYWASVSRGNSTPGGSDPWLGLFNNINIANATYGWGIYDSSADGSFQIWNKTNSTTGAVALTIKRGGNVGIGTTNLGSGRNLTVAGGAISVTGQNLSHSASCMVLGQDSTAISQIRFYGANASTAGALQFTGSSSDGVVGGERMRIDSSGKVGIGTTSPNTMLHVDAPNGTTYPTLGTASGVLGLGINELHGMYLGVDGSSGNGWMQVMREDGTGTAYNLILQPGGGNVGIGTTNPVAELAVGTNARRIEIAGTDGVIRGFDRSASWAQIDFEASSYTFDCGGTLALTLDSSGNLLVGNTVTNPASGFNNQRGLGYAASSGKVEIATTANDAVIEIGKNNANNGNLLVFRKQSTSIGSIGVEGGDALYIQSGTTSGSGLHFHPTGAVVRPARNGSTIDDTINLGTANRRFKNLHLSGTANAKTVTLGSGSNDAGILYINDASSTAYTLALKGSSTREYTFEGSSSGGEYNLYMNNASVADGFNLHVYGSGTFNQNGDDYDFRVESAGNAHMLFVDAGNNRVGIGASLPQETLEVRGGTTSAIRVSGGSNTNSKVQIGYDVSDGPYIKAGSSGINKLQVRVDNTSLAAEFRSNGDFYSNDGTVHSLSDARVKKDINDLADGLDIVIQLKPRTFKYTEDSEFYNESKKDEVSYGFVANEVEKVAPQYTNSGKGKIGDVEVDDLKSLSTTKMIPMLVKAIQEQQTLIESLTARIASLEE